MLITRHYGLPTLKDYVNNSLRRLNVTDRIIEICTSNAILENPEKYPIEVIDNPRLDPVFAAQSRITEIYSVDQLIGHTAKYTAEKVITILNLRWMIL